MLPPKVIESQLNKDLDCVWYMRTILRQRRIHISTIILTVTVLQNRICLHWRRNTSGSVMFSNTFRYYNERVCHRMRKSCFRAICCYIIRVTIPETLTLKQRNRRTKIWNFQKCFKQKYLTHFFWLKIKIIGY